MLCRFGMCQDGQHTSCVCVILIIPFPEPLNTQQSAWLVNHHSDEFNRPIFFNLDLGMLPFAFSHMLLGALWLSSLEAFGPSVSVQKSCCLVSLSSVGKGAVKQGVFGRNVGRHGRNMAFLSY